MRAMIKKIVDQFRIYIDFRDVFAFGGLVMITIGLWQIYPPLSMVVTGTAMFWLGVKR